MLRLFGQLFKKDKKIHPRDKVSFQPNNQIQTSPKQAQVQVIEEDTSDHFVPDADAIEWPKGRQITSYQIKLALTFTYTDSNLLESRRTVDFFEQMVFPPEKKYLRGICRTKGEERIFAMKKMENIFDASTGEIVDDIFSYVKESWKNSPGIILGKWFDKHSNFIVLKGISHALRMHGPPSEKEYAVVIKMANDLTNRTDFDRDAFDMACNIVLPQKSLGGFMETIIKHTPDSWHLFKETVEAIVAARGSTDDDDKVILRDLEKYENRLIANMARDRHDWRGD